MKRILGTILCMLGVSGLGSVWPAASAQAQSTSLGRYGVWSVYSLVTSAGRNVCGMTTRGTEGRSLHVQHVRGSNFILFQAFKSSWTIPRGTRMRVGMRVDGGNGWIAPQASGARRSVRWTMRAGFRRFEAEFRRGSRLTVTFPQGSESPWTVSLNGSSQAMSRMVTCMRHSGGEPTQPFGRTPAPPFSTPAPQPPRGKPPPAAPPGQLISLRDAPA